MAVRKWSVSIDEDIAEEAERLAGRRGLSSFVAGAVRHELERRRLGEYLDELDGRYGPVEEPLIEEYGRQWPS